VPQFLLKNFLGSEKNAKIEVFDKRTGIYREQAIREVAHECGYNHITIGNGTLDGESLSQVFDDFGSAALRPVIEQRSLGLPILQNRHAISQFIIYQLLRGPTAEANIAETFDQMGSNGINGSDDARMR